MNNSDRDYMKALDPRRDPAQWSRMVGAIMRAAGPELARRAATRQMTPVVFLSDWMRPTLAAAAAAAVIAAVSLLSGTGGAMEPGVADVIGYPAPVATWVEGGLRPSVEEFVVALEGGAR